MAEIAFLMLTAAAICGMTVPKGVPAIPAGLLFAACYLFLLAVVIGVVP